MWNWQTILALLALAWCLQCVGTVFQVRRYRAAFRELSSGWTDGWMGVGKGNAVLSGGAIVMIVVAPDETVRRAVVLRGRTVFARATRLPEIEGRQVASVRSETEAGPWGPVRTAILGALDQVEKARAAGAAPAAGEEAESRELASIGA